MAEEAAWLVRARCDSESSRTASFGSIAPAMAYTEDRLTASDGAGEPGNASTATTAPIDAQQDNDSGELLDYNDASVLEQFHEDALRQAGCGLSQARVVLACGLAVAGATLELAAVPFVLPSAEIELCILPHEKNWLVLISVVGGALGSLGWGALCARLGRRRALLSALAVNAVFAVIAAFMPTYGCFMMARFCSALGSGGIVPISCAYAGEMTARGGRGRALAGLAAAAGLGALTAAALAAATLPATGALTLLENKEHFSAWHRYLLLCTLPILASLISLIWTQESPRYLLEVGREVDAMVVYQSIHSSNQFRICGKANVAAAANNRAPAYHLGELSLPGKRRPQASNVKHSIKMFWQTFFQLFSSTYRRYTYALGGVLFFTMVMQFYLSIYVPATIVRMENEVFEASKRMIQNVSYRNDHYNRTLENIEYTNVTFTNCTFRDLLMSHVSFNNCTFVDTLFSSLKTSYTNFRGCLFVNSTIIDSDILMGREIDEWCVLNGTMLRGMLPPCNRHPDLTSRLEPLITKQSYVAHAMLVAAVLFLFPQKVRPRVLLCGLLVLLSPAVYFAQSECALYAVEAVYRAPLTMLFFDVAGAMLDTYPAALRSTAHGLVLSAGYAGCAVAGGVGAGGAIISAVLCCALAGGATVCCLRAR